MVIEFTVYGNPKSLKRHRTTKTGHTYDPSASEKKDFLAQAIQHRPSMPLSVPVSLSIAAVFARPKRHFTKKGLRPDAETWYTQTPDSDNLVKFVGDALNGIFWKDDCCICQGSFSKQYGDAPCVTVRIETL